MFSCEEKNKNKSLLSEREFFYLFYSPSDRVVCPIIIVFQLLTCSSLYQLQAPYLQYIHFLKFIYNSWCYRGVNHDDLNPFHWFFNLYNTGDTSIFVKNITLHVLSGSFVAMMDTDSRV